LLAHLLYVLVTICRYLASQNWKVTERFATTKVFWSDTLPELFVITRYWRLFLLLKLTWEILTKCLC